MTDFLRISSLHVSYGSLAAVRGVDIEVEPGEAIGITGPNGAGKTTMVRAVAGALAIERGDVTFCGNPIGGQGTKLTTRLGIAQVPEGRRLFGDLSVRDNLRIAALAAGQPDEIDEALEVFPALRPLVERLAGNLSGGEQQMVAVGRALLARPKLLLVDELSLGLSPKITADLYQTLARLNREAGLALIVVDEKLHLMEELVQRLYVLSAGEVSLVVDGSEISDRENVIAAYFARA